MLIDIPEQTNCAWCDFCDYEQGHCFLAMAMNMENYRAAEWANKGFDEYECRPDWCPFIQANQ